MTREEHLSKILLADAAYYEDDSPVMSDADYDALRALYIKRYGSSDLDYVPGRAVAFQKYRHDTPILSLAKVKFDETADLTAKIAELWPLVHEPKLDGLTVVAYPRPDGSCSFVTRGNGLVGELLPRFIKKYSKSSVNETGCAVRGEVFMDEATFLSINAGRAEEGLEPFKNPRNAAAGILRNKEKSPYIDSLRYMVYDLPGLDVAACERLALLREKTAFEVVPAASAILPEDEAKEIAAFYQKLIRDGIPLDGVVLKNAGAGSLERFGSTSHHTLNAVAVKFQPERVSTVIRRVVWQVGRESITPVAEFDEVELCGTRVSRASLHNFSNISRLNLSEGDSVIVEKANEIIPQIVENKGGGTAPFKRPSTCPACGAPLALADSADQILTCPNEACPEKIAGSIAYLAGRNVLAIDGLSKKTARKMVDSLVTSPFDIFRLTREEIASLPGFGDVSASRLFDSIQNARHGVDLAHLIASSCVPGIGLSVGTVLMRAYRDMPSLFAVLGDPSRRGELMALDGIGETTADVLMGERFLRALGFVASFITPVPYEEAGRDALTFVITGKLSRPRDAIKRLIESAGHKVTDSVSKNTDYLLTGSAAHVSSKIKKARDLGIKVIGEDALYELLG